MSFKLTRHIQWSKKCKDKKRRSFHMFFLNGRLILKQKRPYDPSYDRGFDGKSFIISAYLLNGSIHQERIKRWYCGIKKEEISEVRNVRWPVSKKLLKELGVPMDIKIELSQRDELPTGQ